MKRHLLTCIFLLSAFSAMAQKPAKPVISGYSEMGNFGVPLNNYFYAYIPTGQGDSMQYEFDTSDLFNSPILYRNTVKSKSSSWGFRDAKAFRLKMNYKMRVRAFANNHTASDWTTYNFKSLVGINTSYSPANNDEIMYQWRPEIIYGNPGCHGEFQISDTSDFTVKVLYSSKLFTDTVDLTNPLKYFAYNLPINKRLYLRTRLYHRGDTTDWTLRTFYLKPQVYLSSPVQTYYSSLLMPDNGYFVTSTDDSLFQYHFEIANNPSFTGAVKRTIWKVRAYNTYSHSPGTTSYVRYRVSHNGNYTPWSNTRTVTTYATIPDIWWTKDFRGYKKLSFTVGNYASRVQIESDTTLLFNSSRRILFDSAAPNPTFYTNYTWERIYKDWVAYRNIYTRYRFGDGTTWTAWSKPVTRYLNPVITTNFTNNQHLMQRFDFDTLIGAAKYIVQCDTDSTFKTANLLTKTYLRTDWNFFMYFPDIWRRYPKLYFRVMATGNQGNSGWSHALVTNQNCKAYINWPDTTELTRYPEDKLSVNNVEGANRLKYEVSYYRDFRSIWASVNNTKSPMGNPELMVPLEYGTKVYVRAKYYNKIDSTPWSNVWPVKVEYYYYCMQKPILISPPDKSLNVNSATTRFTWNAVPESKSYLIQFTDPANGNIVYSDFADSTAIVVNGLPAGKKLKWQVLAIGNKKSQFFSESFELTTDYSVKNTDIRSGDIKIWPNPANERLYVSGSKVRTIRLYNSGFAEVAELQAEDGSFDLRSLLPGLYFVKMISADGVSACRKLIIQR